MSDLAIFVDSYDANIDLWENVFSVMDYYWPDCGIPKYLVTNELQYTGHGVQTIQVGEDRDWLVCTLKGLSQLEQKYIFFMFEDYFFSKKVTDGMFWDIVERMDQENVFFYRLSTINGMDKTKKACPIPVTFPYAINLQPAIWKRETLIAYLRDMQREGISTPWQFEYYFIDRANKGMLPSQNGFVKGVLYDTRDIMGYQNAIIQGKWVKGVIKKYRNIPDLRIDTGKRPFMTAKAEVWNSVKQFGHRVIPYKGRERVKKIMKKIHFNFMR